MSCCKKKKTDFSAEARDVTPIKRDYTPGLGDRCDAISYTIGFGWLGQDSGLNISTTYAEALEIEKKMQNLLNGIHQTTYVLGQDILRWGTAPYLLEDCNPPFGDGTPGSGYARYREFVRESFKYNADAAQILEPLLAGRMRNDVATGDDVIPPACYTHDEDGNLKVGWEMGDEYWYLLSLHNVYKTGYGQKAWQRNMERWNYRTHLYYDALFPVPEGHYNNPNRTTEFGGEITDTETEWRAVENEIKYSWENFAISSGQEYLYPRYKGLSVYYSLPYGYASDDDYLNLWGNSMLICTRGGNETNLVWGAETGDGEDAFQFNGSHQPWGAFIKRMMEHNLQYLYMLERKPLSYTNNNELYQVVFSGNLVSAYDRKAGKYTLIENGDFVIADGGDRFIPQVGAGCKIYVYSAEGGERRWKLPTTWCGVEAADLYVLSTDSAAKKSATLSVCDGCVTVTAEAGVPYILVPAGDNPTPCCATFNDLNEGDTVTSYRELTFKDADIKVYGASARGGFTSPSIYADTCDKEKTFSLDAGKGTILHSLKIGNKGGEGKAVLHSSNPKNSDVMISLPDTDEIYKLNTGWIYGECGEVLVKIENSQGVRNVLLDTFVYSPAL